MSESEKIIDNTSENEVLSNTKQSIVGDIYVQDVHKSFGVTKALDGVNFSANFGEIHAIVGPNGCGKVLLPKYFLVSCQLIKAKFLFWDTSLLLQ